MFEGFVVLYLFKSVMDAYREDTESHHVIVSELNLIPLAKTCLHTAKKAESKKSEPK